MFIKTKPVSAEIQRIVAEGLRAESAPQSLLESMGGGGEASTAKLSFPHEAYFMQLKDVAEGKPLGTAYPTGTRVLLTDGQNKVYSAAEVNQGEKARPVHFEERRHLEPMLEGIERFSARDSPARLMYENLEVRLLRIPALYITAVWLHNEQKDIELLMPVGVVSPPLTAYQVYNGAAFLKTIQEIAAERLAQFNEEKYNR